MVDGDEHIFKSAAAIIGPADGVASSWADASYRAICFSPVTLGEQAFSEWECHGSDVLNCLKEVEVRLIFTSSKLADLIIEMAESLRRQSMALGCEPFLITSRILLDTSLVGVTAEDDRDDAPRRQPRS